MCCVGRIVASMLLAVVLGSTAQPALANSGQLGPEQARLLLFSSTDLWRHGGFAHGGLLWAPNGLDQEGPVLKLMFGGGVYRYASEALGNIDVRGEVLAGGILPGWRFIRDKLYVTLFAGYDFQSHRLFPDDPTAGLRGNYSGLRTGFELWYEPNKTTMVAADASISTVGPSYSARLAAGWRIFDWFYLGPELAGFAAGDNYQQFRVGLHITGFRTAAFEWSAGLGYASDSDNRGGVYGKLGVFTRR